MEQTNHGEPQHFHCSDCDLTVHANDKENHVNGARHKYRLRRKLEEGNKTEAQFQCVVCDTEFTDMHFYTIHQGSKTHKRNLRRIQRHAVRRKGSHDVKTPTVFRPTGRRVPIQGSDTHSITDAGLNIKASKETCDYKSIREKYRPRNTKNPEGNNKSYICSVIAYWAASLALEPNVQDFKLCINDKEWGDFGDAVLQIVLKETKEHPILTTTFAIHFKDISNNVKSIDSFDGGRFGIAKFITQVNAIKLREDVDNKKFVVFTTALADANIERQIKLKSGVLHRTKQNCNCKGEEKDVSIVAKSLSNRRKLLINTSEDNENIFFFFSTDNVHTLPTIYLYTHQKKHKHFGIWIDNLASESLNGDRRVDIHRDFSKYIEYWGDGYLGGHYRLKKEDVLVKLGHLLLYSFKIPPVVSATEKHSYDIWQQAVNSVDVTILKKHPIIISKVCQPINLRIETELDLNIDITNATIVLNQTNIKKIHSNVLKMYLFEETMGDIQDDIPIDLVYDFFWKAGLIPLLLQVEDVKDQEYVLSVVSLLKSLGLTRRYFLITSAKNIKASLKYYKSLSFFTNVDDIASKLPSFVLECVKINVTENFSLSLKSIQEPDMLFQKTINAHEFFDMILGRYSFKPFSNSLARKDGQESQLVLADGTMIHLKENIESKDELKMVIVKKESDERKNFLRDVRPNLFC